MTCKWRWGFLLEVSIAAIGFAFVNQAIGDEPESKAAAANQFSGTSVTHANAVVFAIDSTRNSITLLEDNGEPIDVVVDRSIGDVDKLRLGDTVAITFSRALLLRADTSDSSGIRERVDSAFTTAKSLGSSMSMHRIKAVTTVAQIDRANHRLTLRGPTRTVTLQASSDRLLDGLKEGDSVRVDYVEATAVQITRDGVPLR
jgi:Cu/Ag efflux protein CusF